MSYVADADLSASIHQASGMVSVQLGCSLSEALGRMRVLARSTDRTLDLLAADVLERRYRFIP